MSIESVVSAHREPGDGTAPSSSRLLRPPSPHSFGHNIRVRWDIDIKKQHGGAELLQGARRRRTMTVHRLLCEPARGRLLLRVQPGRSVMAAMGGASVVAVVSASDKRASVSFCQRALDR